MIYRRVCFSLNIIWKLNFCPFFRKSDLEMLGPHCHVAAIRSTDVPCGLSLSSPSVGGTQWTCGSAKPG